MPAPKTPKDWSPANPDKRIRELEKALGDLTKIFLEGANYDTRNPYTRPEVKEAIRLLDSEAHKNIYGPL